MASVCRTCSRVNPLEAQFCYFDGVALDSQHQGGPVAAGAKPFPSPFVFPTGRQCYNFDELARTCEVEWNAALELLKDGFFESFLGTLGRTDLAMFARRAAKESDPDRGLDQFLDKLPVSNREPAKLVVQPLEINLGEVSGERRFVVHLENQGAGLLTGTIAGDGTNWLAFGDAPGVPQKMFQCRQNAEIAVHLVGKNLRAGNKPSEGRIRIESNGGTAVIQVRVVRPVQPFLEGVLAGAKLPREIAAKAKANPKAAAVLFEKGAVKAWYEANGWTYPVQGPSSSGLGAIQQFFEALGLVKAPKVTISHDKIEFRGKPGSFLEHVLQVQTTERRPVFANATTNAGWLQIGAAIRGGRTVGIPIRVPSVPATPGERFSGTVQVVSNGNQRFTVEVELTVAGARYGGDAYAAVPVLDLREALAEAPVMELAKSVPVLLEIETTVEAVKPTVTAPPVKPKPAVPPAVITPLEEVQTVIPKKPNPAILDVVPADEPVLDVVPALARSAPPPRSSSCLMSFVHSLPVFLLVFFLSVPCVHDSLKWMWNLATRPTTVDPPPEMVSHVPRLELAFHDQDKEMSLGTTGLKEGAIVGEERLPVFMEPSMRFGVQMIADAKGQPLQSPKLLTRYPDGLTNNTVVRLDNKERIFGEQIWRLKSTGMYIPMPDKDNWNGGGHWRSQNEPLGNDANGQPRSGRQSVWVYDLQKISITQIVEIVDGPQSGVPDTVLVRYVLANEGRISHRVGIRFLLDTFIGSNDGVPFLIPGQTQLCTTQMDFNAQTMPDYIQALENENDLANPGTIARVQLKVGGGLEAPSRVTLGGWPDPKLMQSDPRCRQEKTLWDVPLMDIHTIPPGDSAVTLYWEERPLGANEKREVGFAYGLAGVSGGEGGGKLAVTVGGSFLPRGKFTVTAYVSNPTADQTVTLTLPKGFSLVEGAAQRPVPRPEGNNRVSPVTWTVQGPSDAGTYKLKVESSNGTSQTQPVKIQAKGIFGSN